MAGSPGSEVDLDVAQAGPDADVGRNGSTPLNVIFNYGAWLPLTESWIHTQAQYLPDTVTPLVVCSETRNLDRFDVANLYCYSQMSRRGRVAVLLREAASLGMQLGRRGALIAAVARSRGARLVHSHFGYTGHRYCKLVAKLGLKHVVTFYGVDASALPAGDSRWIRRYRRMFGIVDRILCEGPHMARTVAMLGCAPEKIAVHRLGIRLEDLPFYPRQLAAGTPLRVLMAGSFREKKGIPYALQALGRVKDEFPIEITLIGDAGEAKKSREEKRRIIHAIAANGLERRIRLLGYQPFSVLKDEAYRHHLFLSPSVTAEDGDTEGGAPVAIIEMAATGMPVLASRHADIPDVIEDGVGGLLADERDVAGLAEHLRWFWANPHKWGAMTASARARIEAHHDASNQGERLAEIYRKLVA